MKNTFIGILVLVFLGIVLFAGKDKELEVVKLEGGDEKSVVVDSQMPALDSLDVEEKIVTDTSPQGQAAGNNANTIVKEFTITGDNFSFTPSTITVKKGDRVKITFKNNKGYHDFVIDEFGVATKQAQAPATEVLEFTADKVGSFEYYCSVGTHRSMGMKGVLKIE